MADNNYSGKPFIYESRGLDARHAPDRVGEGFFLNNLNCFEREESAMSSRYGNQIINRDAAGVGASNYYFSAPVTSLARFLYVGNAWRYAGTGDGNLWRRTGDGQGAFTDIYSGLSGQPFQSLITNCYETSQPYIFIYDAAQSIKDSPGFIAAPQITGIDPPDYTANSLPYSPLLTLVDNFSATNSYSASGFASGWNYGSVATIHAQNGYMVTDFPQFLNIGSTAFTAGTGTISSGRSSTGSSGNNTIVSGFPSQPLSAGQYISVTIDVSASTGASGAIESWAGEIQFQYSIDGGTTWVDFKSFANGGFGAGSAVLNTTTCLLSFPWSAISNLNLLQFQIVTSISLIVPTPSPGSGDAVGNITLTLASINTAGTFANACDGILSVLNTDAIGSIPIVSVESINQVGGIYQDLAVTTAVAHHLSASNNISIYGSSNDLVDGFYGSIGITAANALTVPYLSAVQLSAIGGFVNTASNNAPNTCVLTDEYSAPYPTQMSAWGFYEQVATTASNFPIGAFSGTITASNTATVGNTANFDLSINNQVTDFDLIALTINVTDPQNVANIRLQFDVNGSNYTSSYYYANIAPAFYQGNIANEDSAYQTTQNQILADTLGLLTGQPVGSTTGQLQPSNFSTGSGSWVAVYIPRGNFLPVGSAGQSGLDWTNITGWQLVIENSVSGPSTVAVNGLYLQWGYGPSSFGGVGYDWRYTYYNQNTGTESSPSPEQFFAQQYGYLSSLTKPFYFRQAAQVTGQYSIDSQVTHLRMYRRGGIYNSNWLLIDQVPNVTAAGAFQYKDVVPDASLAEAQPLALDNDPPVTSSLVNPIQTTLAVAATGPGNSIYSTFAPQPVTVADGSIIFVQNQTVLIGNSYNLEEALVVSGGSGQFTAILRLQHNAGEQVSATSVPRAKCNLCALAYGLVWLAGDQNNPHYLYRCKQGYPENFSPADYMAVSSPDDPIMAPINWRGTLIVATLKTWYVVANGATVPQPTGAAHGLVATGAWALVEGAILFRSADGWRIFEGADGVYTTLPVEWIFRNSPATIVPKANPTQSASDVFCYYQNQLYGSYISASNNQRYRLAYDTQYKRFRLDDVPATAMLWERDINSLLVGKQIGASEYAVVQDWVGDYDDGGWRGDELVQTPINLDIWTPFRDLGRPHNPKQWNVLEGDYNTQGQAIQTTLYFKGEQDFSLALPAETTTNRSKVQYQIPPSGASNAQGVEAYSMSIRHTMAVTVAPILFQENIFAVLLADERTSWDSYWQKTSGDYLQILPKNVYVDYSGDTQLTVQLFADGSLTPYYADDFTLVPQANRSVVRVQGPARKGRLWRVVITAASPFQLWAQVRCEVKPLEEGSGYAQHPFEVSQ